MTRPVPFALLRHGPTAWNAEHRLQGRSDQPLSEAGEELARRWQLPPDVAHWRRVSSPLRRARRTAALLRPQMPFTVVPALIEMSFGEWEGRTLRSLEDEGGEEFRRNEKRGLDLQPPGGETPRMVLARLRPWLADVARSGVPVLAITHKGVQRALLSLATGWTMIDKPTVRLRSQAIHLFEIDGQGTLRLQQANIAIDEPDPAELSA
jgi:probable phosphoglycerate mutase